MCTPNANQSCISLTLKAFLQKRIPVRTKPSIKMVKSQRHNTLTWADGLVLALMIVTTIAIHVAPRCVGQDTFLEALRSSRFRWGASLNASMYIPALPSLPAACRPEDPDRPEAQDPPSQEWCDENDPGTTQESIYHPFSGSLEVFIKIGGQTKLVLYSKPTLGDQRTLQYDFDASERLRFPLNPELGSFYALDYTADSSNPIEVKISPVRETDEYTYSVYSFAGIGRTVSFPIGSAVWFGPTVHVLGFILFMRWPGLWISAFFRLTAVTGAAFSYWNTMYVALSGVWVILSMIQLAVAGVVFFLFPCYPEFQRKLAIPMAEAWLERRWKYVYDKERWITDYDVKDSLPVINITS